MQAEAHRTGRHRSDHERRDAPPRALGAVEVAARGLDVDGADGSSPSSAAIASRIGSRWRPEPRPGGDDRQVDARRTPAGGSPETARTSSMSRRLAMPSRRPGVGREEPAEVAQPGGAEQGVGQRRAGRHRRRSGRPARGAPAISIPPRSERLPGPERVAVVPDPGPRRRVRSGRPRPVPRSAGSVTLRLPGSPGTTWTAMLQASSRAASSVNVAGPSAGKRRYASRRRSRRTPCGVCAAPRSLRSTVAPDQLAVEALERLRDGHDRDRRPVLGGRRRDGADERRVDERAGTRRGRARPRSRRAPARSNAANPAATDSCRRSPPATTSIDARRQPGRGGHDLGRRGLGGDDDDPRDRRRRGERVEGPGEQRPAADLDRQLVACRPSARCPGRRRR